jgi:hypothetical protein
MDTPLLYMHGDNDQIVEYNQGMEFYNALRFNRKPVIFLSYPGEGHSLSKLENQLDYQLRMAQFYGHYLKGEPRAAGSTAASVHRQAAARADPDAHRSDARTVRRGARLDRVGGPCCGGAVRRGGRGTVHGRAALARLAACRLVAATAVASVYGPMLLVAWYAWGVLR